jgi:DNA topoisomerase-1
MSTSDDSNDGSRSSQSENGEENGYSDSSPNKSSQDYRASQESYQSSQDETYRSSQDSTYNSTRTSEGDQSDEDVPLSKKIKKEERRSSSRSPSPSNGNNKNYDSESEEDKPLSKRAENGAAKVKKEVKREDSEDEYSPSDDGSDYGSKKKKKKSSKKDKKKKDKSSKKSSKKRKAESDSEDDYEEDEKPKKKSKSSKKDSKKSSKKSSESPSKGSPKKKKEEDETHVWRWWEESDLESDTKWKTLEHNGPFFAPEYERLPDHVKFRYNGKHMKLSKGAEEVACFYGKMLDHEYTSKKVFNDNFFKDWRKFMTPEEKDTIKDLSKCNFSEINDYFKEQSEIRKNMSKEEKKEIKEENDRIAEKFGTAIVDGHKQKIGNFRLEPPGLFRGRGEHPKMGKVKRRIEAEDIIINIGKKAVVPKPPEGHKWKEVRHDNTVTWLVSWTENIMGNVKYIMLNPSSKIKSMKDWKKYEKARELHEVIDNIREDYMRDWKDREMVKRQRAVALYFIDKLALRAGNEKDEGEAADTVGCCSLRYEHVNLFDERDGKSNVVEFDFPGKDSIRYFNQVSVPKKVYKNLKLFLENKKKGDDLFDRLNTMTLNKYLNTLMEGLSAKVFRTYNASITLERQLEELMAELDRDATVAEKVLAYNRANRAVAILCNHQRTVPKGFEDQMEKIREKISNKKKEVKALKKELKENKKDEKIKKKLATAEEQLRKLKVQETDREENKQIALGTSKLNYLDPRITVAW